MMVHRTITFYGEEAEVISIAMKQKDARVSELEAQLAERDKIIALTREALAAMVSYAREEGKCLKIADDALDATKDLSGLTLCDAEPIGYFAYSEMETGGVWEELFGPEYPGATALYAKRTEKK